MASTTITVTRGRSRDARLQALLPDGTVPTIFLGSDTLSASVWRGDAQAPLLGPAVAWAGDAQATAAATLSGAAVAAVAVTAPGLYYSSPPAVSFTGGGGSGATATAATDGSGVTAITVTGGGAGYTSAPAVTVSIPAVVTVSLFDADTADWELGLYDLAVYLTRAGRSVPIVKAKLRVDEAAGADTPRPAYCSYPDMKKWAPWLETIQQEQVLEGFADQRADAREWFDDLVLRAYRGGAWGNYEHHSRAGFAWAGGGPRRQLGKSVWLTQRLAEGKLMLLPEVLRLNAWYAIYLACNQQIEQGTTWKERAARFYGMAISGVLDCTAQIDTSGNGFYAVAIPLGSTNPLFT